MARQFNMALKFFSFTFIHVQFIIDYENLFEITFSLNTYYDLH